MNLDGTAIIHYPVLITKDMDELEIHPILVHYIDQAKAKTPVSAWELTGISSYLRLVEDGKLLWLAPNGVTAVFDARKIGYEFEIQGDAFGLRSQAPGEVDIRANNGTLWRYKAGILQAITMRNGSIFSVVADGKIIREIDKTNAESGKTLVFKLEYENSLVKTILVGQEFYYQLSWDKTGSLRAVRLPNGKTIVLDYLNGVIETIVEPGQRVARYKWASTEGYIEGAWPSSIHVVSDNVYDYRYKLTRRGADIVSRNRTSGHMIHTLFNPVERALAQEDGKEVTRIRFGETAIGWGRIVSVDHE